MWATANFWTFTERFTLSTPHRPIRVFLFKWRCIQVCQTVCFLSFLTTVFSEWIAI